MLVTAKHRQRCLLLHGKHKRKAASTVHHPPPPLPGMEQPKGGSYDTHYLAILFQVQIMVRWETTTALTVNVWEPRLVLNRNLSSALTDVLLQPCVPVLQFVIKLFSLTLICRNTLVRKYTVNSCILQVVHKADNIQSSAAGHTHTPFKFKSCKASKRPLTQEREVQERQAEVTPDTSQNKH